MSNATTLTTYFGNSIDGITVTWTPNGLDSSGVPSDALTDKMEFSVVCNLYALGSSVKANSDSSATDFTDDDTALVYLMWQNPYDSWDQADDSSIYDNEDIAFDGILATLTGNTATANEIKFDALAYTDLACTKDVVSSKYDAVNCVDDTTLTTPGDNDFTEINVPGDSNYCTETWDFGGDGNG